VERDFASLLTESRRFLADGRGLAGAADAFLRIARLYDVAGRLEDARDAYILAFEEGAPDVSLLWAGLLSVEMNDAHAFSDILARGKGHAASALLEALAAYTSGDRDAASRQLVDLASGADDPYISLKAMWILSQTPGAATAGGPSLGVRFAGSPEAALAAAASGTGASASGGAGGVGTLVVHLSPSPGALGFIDSLDAPATASQGQPGAVADGAPVPAETAPSGGTAAGSAPRPDLPASPPVQPLTPGVLYMVQAGAFQVRENADDLVTEIARKGFTPSIMEDTSQGKQRFRVLAGAGLANDQAQALLLKLTKAGYSGFVAAQKADPSSSSRQPSG
jgi:cell division septation protein DedD